MKALVLGATGYVGGAVAGALQKRNFDVSGTFRSGDGRDRLMRCGIAAVEADITDFDCLPSVLPGYDVVVFATMLPFEVEADAVASAIDCLRGSGSHLIFTSGTGVLSLESREGEWSEFTSAEDDPFPYPASHNRSVRLQTEELVRSASGSGLHTAVVRPPLIYGKGGSIHVPLLFRAARALGKVPYLGRGLNLYSNVHISDLAELYCRVIERGISGALYHAVGGEANFRSIAEAVAGVMRCRAASFTYDELCDHWGQSFVDIAISVNSRAVAKRAREELGWKPVEIDLIEDIRSGSYREAYLASDDFGPTATGWSNQA